VHWAALQGNLPMCVWLRKLGLDLSLANNQGHTALHKAAYKGHAPLCRWLIENTTLGCSRKPQKPAAVLPEPEPEPEPDSEAAACCAGFRRDGGGYTPAMIAREQRHEALATWLEAEQQSSCCARHSEPSTGAEPMQLTGPLGKLEVRVVSDAPSQ